MSEFNTNMDSIRLGPDASDNLKVLVIDDNPADRELYKQYLIDEFKQGYEFLDVGLGEEAIKVCSKDNFDCILLDYNLPDLNGVEFLSLLDKEIKARTPVIMLTGEGNETIAADALRSGATDYLPKRVVSTESLKRTIGNAVEKFHLRKAIESQTHRLEEKNRELTRKHDEIQRFYQTVSHELKTPLTSIKEFACILQEGISGDINDEQKEYLQIIKDSCMQMANGVNDLLDITRLETGKLRVELEPNDVGSVIDKVIAAMKVIAKYKSIEITAHIEESLPDVYMDPNRVEQILTNLINNAIKFTDHHGRVYITAEVDSDKSEYVKISVFDNGCGISPKDLENIFDRLYQVNPEQNSNDTCTSLGGLGLGLNICRELVNLHDGKIMVKSLVNKGSEFCFTLPVYDKDTGINSIIQEVNLDTLIKEQAL